MLAIDTNVVIRYLANDHPEQSARARSLIDGNAVWISTTVLLETGWVLRAALEFDRSRISRTIRGFCGLPTVSLENPVLAARALDWHDQGMDFADAFHLAASDGCAAFVSFDRTCIRMASKLGAPARQP